MADSPAHKLGQIIGSQLEAAVRQPLKAIAKEYGLYLDYARTRPARGRKKRVSWEDSYGNAHILDYVFEEDGSESALGRPRAFIETAWRRYTKHSRNKAQEIQGAVLPLAETYGDCSPFLGAVLAGDFTEASLQQLLSHGFHIAYCPYDEIVRAFQHVKMDISFEEDTSEAELQRKVDVFKSMTVTNRNQIPQEILKVGRATFDSFFSALRNSLERHVKEICVLTLSGRSHEFGSIDSAVHFVSSHDESASMSRFVRYEIIVRYTTGDEVRGDFRNKRRAISFLQKFAI